MKKILSILSLFLSLPSLANEVPLGEETILPLRFPKLNVDFEYPLKREFKGFSEGETDGSVNSLFGGGMSFETGLFNNFNAGAGFSACWPTDSQREEGNGAVFRFFFLGKPYISLTERISIFAKFALGLSTGFFPESQTFIGGVKLSRHRDYLLGFGFNGSALGGINFFPWSRVGFFVEAGIGSDLFWFQPFGLGGRSEWVESEHAHPKGHWIRYMIYEFPLNIGIHIIL